MKSEIFTQKQLKQIEERIKGNKKDPTGSYAKGVKPKLKELLSWFKKIKTIKKLLK